MELATPVLCQDCGAHVVPPHACPSSSFSDSVVTDSGSGPRSVSTEPDTEPPEKDTHDELMRTVEAPRVRRLDQMTEPRAPRPRSAAGLIPGATIGEYIIEAPIGEGGVGRVYRARHSVSGKRVAIKTLKSEYASDPLVLRRFFGEAKAVTQLAHPNIVKISECVESEYGISYLIMELLEGVSLVEFLGVQGSLSVPLTVEIALQITSALEVVHNARIVHRDLKPGNIYLIDRGGGHFFVKLLDFGVAKLSDSRDGSKSFCTRPGALLGTPEFMSPEQSLGQAVDHRSDIYSFGVLLYEMLTGERPFIATKMVDILELQRKARPRHPSEVGSRPDLPRRLASMIFRCLEKDPANRPQSMAIVREELLTIAREQHLIETEMLASRPRRRRQRRAQLWAFSVTALAALVTCALVLATELKKRSTKNTAATRIPAHKSMCVPPLMPRAVSTAAASMSMPVDVPTAAECAEGVPNPTNETALIAASAPQKSKRALKKRKKGKKRKKAKRHKRRRHPLR